MSARSREGPRKAFGRTPANMALSSVIIGARLRCGCDRPSMRSQVQGISGVLCSVLMSPDTRISSAVIPHENRRELRTGLAQLSLVEHALCQLDTRESLRPAQRFETGFFYTDHAGARQFADVQVGAALGFSPADEYYLWGLLALTFNQPQPTRVFHATPYYCLRKLGFGDSGKHYAEFRGALTRIAGLSYACSAFYDPVRKERRRVGFQFLSYSLPLTDDSARAWEFTWNEAFFEHCAATGGKLFFELTSRTYRELDPASRRLYLVLHKVFWRRRQSPHYELRHLATQVLGFSPMRPTYKLKHDVTRCVERLLAADLLTLPEGTGTPAALFQKRSKGRYSIQFHRGPYFEKSLHGEVSNSHRAPLADSPLYDPLRAIRFEEPMIRWILRRFKPSRIQIWADVTLAKLEREGKDAFSAGPQAYFLDNLKAERTKPDWYLELKKQETQTRERQARDELLSRIDTAEAESAYRVERSKAWRAHLERRGVSREEYQRVTQLLVTSYGEQLDQDAAIEQAAHDAERRFAAGFEFPDRQTWIVENYVRRQLTESADEL